MFIPYQDKLVVIYNDYKKNIEGALLADDVHQKGGAIIKELSLAYAVLNNDGTIESRRILQKVLHA